MSVEDLSYKPFSWSYSALNNFEVCPRRYEAYSVTKEVKEPESEHTRHGHTVHRAFEARVAFGEKLPLGLGMHEPTLAKLAEPKLGSGSVFAERKLAINRAGDPVTWFAPDAWFRQVIDYTYIMPEGAAMTIDYKTGRPKEDVTQLRLASAMLFAHDTTISHVSAGYWFVEHNQWDWRAYTAEDRSEIWEAIIPRVAELETARARDEYPPRPGGLCRKFCAVKSCPFWGK